MTKRFFLISQTTLVGLKSVGRLYYGFSRIGILLCVFCSISMLLFAGNSVFSFYGSPTQNYGNDVYGMTMGDVGISDLFRQNTGYANPAVLGNINKTIFSTGLMPGWTTYTTKYASTKSYRDNSLDFPYFSLGVPVMNHRVGFQFNSVTSGVVQNQTTFVTEDSITVLEKNSIDRYIYRADLLYAFTYKRLNLGLGFNYYLGHDIRLFYQNGGFGYFNTKEVLERTYKNPGFSAGMTYKAEAYSIGGTYSSGATLEGDEIRRSLLPEEDLGNVKYGIAPQIGLGATVMLGKEFKVSSDLRMEMWENTDNTANTQNSMKLGIGLAQEPKLETKHTFLGQMPKRLGYSYRILPFEVNAKTVAETAFSAGITLPLKQSNNQLDFGIQYFLRGNLDDHQMQDKGFMFLFGITGFDVLSRDASRTAPRDIPVPEEISE